MASRKPQFNREQLFDTTPLPDSIPKVKELGASSAPLLSASFFIGARCGDYNDDFMKCKTDAAGRAQFDCLKEGRRVTRCARSVIEDVNTHCLREFRKHWECLDNNNQQLWQCRPDEWALNKCVFVNLGLKKTIPDAMGIPIHERQSQIFAHGGGSFVQRPGAPSIDARKAELEPLRKLVEEKLSKDTPPPS